MTSKGVCLIGSSLIPGIHTLKAQFACFELLNLNLGTVALLGFCDDFHQYKGILIPLTKALEVPTPTFVIQDKRALLRGANTP